MEVVGRARAKWIPTRKDISQTTPEKKVIASEPLNHEALGPGDDSLLDTPGPWTALYRGPRCKTGQSTPKTSIYPTKLSREGNPIRWE